MTNETQMFVIGLNSILISFFGSFALLKIRELKNEIKSIKALASSGDVSTSEAPITEPASGGQSEPEKLA